MTRNSTKPNLSPASTPVVRSSRFSVRWAAHRLAAVACFALALCPAGVRGSPHAEGHIVVVESSGAAGKIDRQRLTHIIEQACAELHVDESAIPEIVLIHVANDEARAGGVPAGTTVMVERSALSVEWKADASPARFLIWVVGKPDDQKMVGAVAHVLRLHLRMELSDRDLLLAEERILQRMNATVNVNSFVK